MNQGRILAIDQGTSSSRTVVYGDGFEPLAGVQLEFPQIYPEPGWVEHDPEAIWSTVVETLGAALRDAGLKAADLGGIGITNQRETTLVWDRNTGECVYNAIVWQDRRTAPLCDKLKSEGQEPTVMDKTGLRLDPYFSATKVAWILDNVDGVRKRSERGELAFGTIDSYLLWRLTGGDVHATDATNASRTMLFNIHDQEWDEDLLQVFNVPRELLPEVCDSAADYGAADAGVTGGEVPILGMAGDQQAALIGQAGFDPGMTKSTYGTGCFVIANTGDQALVSTNQLLTTVAMRLAGRVTYGLEGSVFIAGSAIQWLRDELQVISSAPESEEIAKATGVVEDVHVVPAFAGLGAPYWDARARGAITGLTRGSGKAEIVTATLQAVAYQTHDLVDAMAQDGMRPSTIRVDGGMVANDWMVQFLADITGLPVERPVQSESTALGAAMLAGMQAGIWPDLAALGDMWERDARFEPAMPEDERDRLLAGWRNAVERTLTK